MINTRSTAQTDELSHELEDHLGRALALADRLGHTVAAIHIQNAIDLIAEEDSATDQE